MKARKSRRSGLVTHRGGPWTLEMVYRVQGTWNLDGRRPTPGTRRGDNGDRLLPFPAH